MRTIIEGGWVVAWNGRSHEVHERGSVVFEDDRIVHAGPAWTGTVDARIRHAHPPRPAHLPPEAAL